MVTVRGIWNWVLYGSCFLVLAAQVLGSLLEQLGVLIWSVSILLSDMEWIYWTLYIVPHFATMTFLLAEQKRTLGRTLDWFCLETREPVLRQVRPSFPSIIFRTIAAVRTDSYEAACKTLYEMLDLELPLP